MIVVDPKDPRGIIWIASYPKSGNTWIRVFLYHLTRLSQGHPRAENDLHELDNVSGYEARFFSLFSELLGKPLQTATLAEVMAVRMKLHAVVAERSPGVALIKTHNLLGTFGEHPIINLNASAGTIYIVRDPRDVVISLSDHLGSTINEAIGVLNTSMYTSQNNDQVAYEMWGSWSEHVKAWTMDEHKAVIVVRYEDMLADPMEQFSAITKHIRQAPTEEHLREAVELSSFKELFEQESQIDFRERSAVAERFFRVGEAGQWRERLSRDQIQLIIDTHGEQMQRYGYLD